jgi:hypothetical protein
MRTATEQQALRILAEILTPLESSSGEFEGADDYSSVRDVAAEAGGLVHRNAHLLTKMPAQVALRGKFAIPDDQPCLINSLGRF